MAEKSTPHINPKGVDIAETVLLPGDPLRAKFIADTYLEDVVQFNSVRNMLGFTGTYQGTPVSVMGSGMGMPSIGIYSYELINFFDARNVIRVGSIGAMQKDIDLYEIIVAASASTDSNFLEQYNLPGTYAPTASWTLLKAFMDEADRKGKKVHVGNILSSDVFYNADSTVNERWARMGVLGVEMESAALYSIAAYAGANALGVFTVSDNLFTGARTTAEERESAFTDMMELALPLARA
ncbi:purine-nucleoside phosphorylase [Corynebacterium diphtheriae]|uniref:Uridine phosphorylase n=1 Tax=Corynebacterium rouxii TaxID=2719119 RepID=A0A6I8MF24_9CORY|nr:MULTISPECIES: purine-nucleoside phosphorylase [Corynebacterium]UWE72035.1 purine-nucleoside phosphorylase [Corynebacterium diphtheriae bv. mitis]EIK57044.1 purine nucleoside phosphorylase [Corynebacterium diphtheriae bv. intermedius str. NCTC 5011]MBG9343450.1 purine-nucleoside phosphorylase [Corynebacterium diphtheriae]OJH89236.1 purine-nucleoside phosphorylase [Corynebacterium diphtheriae]OWM40303.1 purine-nucleoside phosphorylase [Corynebacterium diphtheriae bv. intermedius]